MLSGGRVRRCSPTASAFRPQLTARANLGVNHKRELRRAGPHGEVEADGGAAAAGAARMRLVVRLNRVPFRSVSRFGPAKLGLFLTATIWTLDAAATSSTSQGPPSEEGC